MWPYCRTAPARPRFAGQPISLSRVYTVIDDAVVILRIRHGARKPIMPEEL
jgi:hypothetical protein